MEFTPRELAMINKNESVISLVDLLKLINFDFAPKHKVMVIGGSKEIPGAPLLTANAAKKCGAKAVAITSTPEVIDKAEIIYGGALMLKTINDWSVEGFKQALSYIKKYKVIVIGPGMYLTRKARQGLRYFFKNLPSDKVVIIDANVIDFIAENKDLLKNMKTTKILTPNTQEFEMLLNKKVSKSKPLQVVQLAKKFCKQYNTNLLIKGKFDIVCNAKHYKLNISGVPVLGVAGSGDSIVGCIAGFLSLENNAFSSIIAGVYVYTRAGEYVFEEEGYSLAPEDVINKIPYVMKELLDFGTVTTMRFYR